MKLNYGNIDPKALDILIKYRDTPINEIPKEDFDYAVARGYMFKDMTIYHDEAVQKLFNVYKQMNKEFVVNTFLASLSSNQISWQPGLALYAILQSFPTHQFIVNDTIENINNITPCKICSGHQVFEGDINYINLLRLTTGKIRHNSYYYLFYLEEQNKLSRDIKPNELDLEIFKDIMILLLNSEESTTPTILLKNLKKSKILKLSDQDQLHHLLEILGYCGILHSEKHKGPFYEYVNLAVAPRKRHSSDWSYPLDWWTGKDGIDKEAFKYWFGDYPELSLD